MKSTEAERAQSSFSYQPHTTINTKLGREFRTADKIVKLSEDDKHHVVAKVWQKAVVVVAQNSGYRCIYYIPVGGKVNTSNNVVQPCPFRVHITIDEAPKMKGDGGRGMARRRLYPKLTAGHKRPTITA